MAGIPLPGSHKDLTTYSGEIVPDISEISISIWKFPKPGVYNLPPPSVDILLIVKSCQWGEILSTSLASGCTSSKRD